MAEKAPIVAISIRDSIIEKLEANLSAILLYGSSKKGNDYCDIDILVILKKNNFALNDLEKLKSTANEFSKLTLDLQFIYESEIKSPNLFSLDAHGAFFTRILKRATVLHGSNPFLDFEPTRRQLLVSLATRIQRYLFHARQEYILGGRHNKDKNPQYHKKHLTRAMFDLLLMNKEWLEDIEVKKLIEERYPEIFSKEDWETLVLETDNVEDYVLLYEKVYDLALKEAYKEIL